MFSCDKCDKAYSRRDYLERHALNHDKPNITCIQCGKAFQRQDVLRKHIRESCKGSDTDHVGEPSRKRQRISSGPRPSLPPSQPSTAITSDLSSLPASIAPAIQWDDIAIPPAAETSNTTGGENVDDILDWLFQHDVGDTVQSLHDTAPFSHENLVENVSPTGLSYSARPVAPITPIEFHPGNTRNPPLQPPRITLQSTLIPLSWTLPEATAVVNDVIRGQMLDMYEDPLRSEMDSLFTLSRMKLFIELYFLHFYPLYPIIHFPSLGYRSLPPDLLLTIICIGTAFTADTKCLDLSARLVKRLRDRIFERVEEDPRIDIASLQTILQLNYFSRSYCSLKQHDISQIFHSPAITLARLSGVFIPNFSAERQPISADPLRRWLDWVAVEERTRLGWYAFMMDTENAALFRHYLLIHCFVIEIPFPDASGAWSAPDPVSWQTAHLSSSDVPTFRTALRDLAGRGIITFQANHELRWILLHGLISVSWTLLWRDLGDLSMVGDSKISQWKDSFKRAFTVLTAHEETQIPEPKHAAVHQAGITFGYLGMMLLMTETEKIRIFAGASSVAARPISPGEWFAANTYVNVWAKSRDAFYAVNVAMKALRKIFNDIDESLYRTTPSVIPWCTYISAILIWSYTSAIEGQEALVAPYVTASTTGRRHTIDIEPSLARRDALAYLDRHLSNNEDMGLPNKNRCTGIIAYSAHLVGTLPRGNIEESRKVLNGLLTEHL